MVRQDENVPIVSPQTRHPTTHKRQDQARIPLQTQPRSSHHNTGMSKMFETIYNVITSSYDHRNSAHPTEDITM